MKVIYAIINLKNGKKYIGSTTNFSRRKVKHLYLLNKGEHHSLSLQHSWNKNISNDYVFHVIEKLSENEDMYIKEQYYLDLYKTYDKKYGYNMSKLVKGVYTTYKTVYQFDFNGNLIKEFPDCTTAADSLNIDNSGLSKCARGKYRFYGGFIWSYDKNISQERINLAKNPIKRSIESRKKMSESAKNRTDKLKPILQYDLNNNFIKEWGSTTELVKEKKYSNGYISDCLNGKHSKAYGYIWKFKNKNE